MNTAMTAQAQGQTAARSGSVNAGSGVSCQQMPLSFLKNGEAGIIAKVRGKGDLHHHMENLGFVEGARVTVVSEAADDLIVEVKGAQVALNKQIAARIITNAGA